MIALLLKRDFVVNNKYLTWHHKGIVLLRFKHITQMMMWTFKFSFIKLKFQTLHSEHK